MMLAALLVQHGGDGRMELSYFWSAILIVLLPMAVFGTLGYLVWKGSRQEKTRNAERGTTGQGRSSP